MIPGIFSLKTCMVKKARPSIENPWLNGIFAKAERGFDKLTQSLKYRNTSMP